MKLAVRCAAFGCSNLARVTIRYGIRQFLVCSPRCCKHLLNALISVDNMRFKANHESRH